MSLAKVEKMWLCVQLDPPPSQAKACRRAAAGWHSENCFLSFFPAKPPISNTKTRDLIPIHSFQMKGQERRGL